MAEEWESGVDPIGRRRPNTKSLRGRLAPAAVVALAKRESHVTDPKTTGGGAEFESHKLWRLRPPRSTFVRMALTSQIEWTEATWNPVTGCTKISAGCDHCYAARFSERFRGVPGHPFETGFDLTLRPERLEQPLLWRRPRMIFVNSMSDLFHKEIPSAFVARVFDTMERADWHEFQLLTKRSSIMRDFVNERYRNRAPPPHVWLGVSVEDGTRKSRVRHLAATRAAVRFLSVEPLIGPVGELTLAGIDWVIVGGESGPRARPMDKAWVVDILEQCSAANVPLFFKQWGGRTPKTGGRLLDGREHNGWPRSARTALAGG